MGIEKTNNTRTIKGEKLWVYVLLIATLTAIGSFLIHETYSLDIWWHVTISKDILGNLAIPNVDVYTAAANGRPYHDSHWFFQVLVGLSHKALGWTGIGLFMLSIWSLILLFCYKSIRDHTTSTVALILLFISSMASVERFLPRPEIMTFLMMAVFYFCFQKDKHTTLKGLILLSILQMIWANSHGLYIIGPFMAGCYLAQELLNKANQRPSRILLSMQALIILGVASFITPFGFHGWKYSYLLFTEVGKNAPEMMKSLGELSPTLGLKAMSAPAFWFFFAISMATSASLIVLIIQKKSPPFNRLLIVIGMFAAACTGRRNIVLFVLVAAPFLAENMKLISSRKIVISKYIIISASILMLAWSVFPYSGKYYLYMEIPARFGLGVTPSFFPHRLPEFLDKTNFTGQVYNSNTLGGFYLFHSYPERRPLSDGRWEIYDHDELQFIRNAPVNPNEWKKLEKKYGIQGILLQHASPEAKVLLPRLWKDPQWNLAFFDYGASFWKIKDTLDTYPEIDVAKTAETLPESSRVEDYIMLELFYSQIDASNIRLKNLEQAFKLGLKKTNFLEQYGMLLIKLGRIEKAKNHFQNLVRKNPKNTKILNEMAYLEFRGGNLERAEELLRRALMIDPEDKDIKINYDRIVKARRRSQSKKNDEK